ncbi:MAG: S8 family serine peptidase [Chitinophagaceae bacterium]|nr:S8 family serine peptidase [Chitinophagaceae bacterium]
MFRLKTVFTLILSFAISCAWAQPDDRFVLKLKNRFFIPEDNVTQDELNRIRQQLERSYEKKLLIIQFHRLPGETQKNSLLQTGIELLDYIPENGFLALLSSLPDSVTLKNLQVRSIVEIRPEDKMAPVLINERAPLYIQKQPGFADVWVHVLSSYSLAGVKQKLAEKNFRLLPAAFESYGLLTVRAELNRLHELAALPFVQYVEPLPAEVQPINNKSTSNSRANVLHSSLPGQRNLRGEGVTIGIGDNSNLNLHRDFSARLIDRAAAAGGAHGNHVSGTAAGAGNISEKFSGYAPRATIVKQLFTGIIQNTPAYIQDYGMIATNNSYGTIVNECFSFGQYTGYSRVLDEQIRQHSSLQHVFAAGNSASLNCSPYPTGFGTVLGDFQTAKNIITVGSTNELGVSSSFSSRGPVRDGRIKPEIVTQGQSVFSTWPTDIYSPNNGTSMAAPAVTGGLALLYQRYRQLHSNNNPKNALIKALLCNGATDLGHPGPDFTHGFGWMNLLRSVTQLENGTYFSGNATTGSQHTQTINVPSNTAALKVLLYWNDPPATLLSAQTLVNDLDLELTDPTSTLHLPFKLDTVPAHVNTPATTGADHINNIEQIVINNPAAGNYVVKVKGTAVPQSPPQEFFVVYDIIPVSTTLTYPLGGERFKPGDSVYISWESYGNPSGTFTLEYSIDGGSNWTTIDNNVSPSSRLYKWFIPNTPTHQARIRVTRNSNGMQSVSQHFVILGAPVVSLAPVQCPTYASITWTTVPSATDYEIMMLRPADTVMQTIGFTSQNQFTIGGLSPDSIYYFSVRARINGAPGPRESTISRQPNSGSCSGSISDNDITLDSLVFPSLSGRLNTSTAFSSNVPVTIRIRNLDDTPTNGNIIASYSINAGPVVTETITNPNIPPGGTYDYTFTTTANLSAVGSYTVQASVNYTSDPIPSNNQITRTIKQLDNPPVNLSTVFTDDFETAPVFSVNVRTNGLPGLDRYDFVSSHPLGRIRSFLNSGMSYSGNRALTLDVTRFVSGGVVDSLTGTFNLSAYNVTSDDIRLDFRFKNHGQAAHPANKVWIRGNDTSPWIEVFDLYSGQAPPDSAYRLSPSLEISDILQASGQNFSSSFQVRWGQFGSHMAADLSTGNGYTFDDIRLYRVTDDIQMISIDTPVVNSCNLSAATPVRITLRNTANNVVSNVPVIYRVNGGPWITENIPSMNPNTIIQYTFTNTADLSATGNYLIEALVNYPTDTYRANDTVRITVVHSPLYSVTADSPYLENFETGTNHWYTTPGSMWEYGTPNSYKIKRAASGTKAWKTRLVGHYDDKKVNYLYSPCFNLSALSHPTLSLSISLDLENCGPTTFCDGAWIEYSTDGKNWITLGDTSMGVNWYNRNYNGIRVWSIQNYHRWHVATIPLSVTSLPPSSLNRIQFRIVISADQAVSREGIAIDDFHLYNNPNGIYTGNGASPVINQNLSGNNWIHFIDPALNKLISSVNPSGINMGNTEVQTFIHTGPVRNNGLQYYHNRNITIKPATVNLPDSAIVRFYFTDAETEALLAATGCPTCTKPSMAYELGVTKYSDPNDNNEDGTLANNTGGIHTFIESNKVKIVPFDIGYYAEFKVKDFSEFWLNNGWINGITPLPLQLLSFSAQKINANDVLLQWITENEQNVSHFEIQVARGNQAYRQNQFQTIFRVPAVGNSTFRQNYQYTDSSSFKSGIYYYRLKIIEQNGNFSYSAIRPVYFTRDWKPAIYPNPSEGEFYLVAQAPEGASISLNMTDASGRRIIQQVYKATGMVQKFVIDISAPRYRNGLYLLEMVIRDHQTPQGEIINRENFKLLKQKK